MEKELILLVGRARTMDPSSLESITRDAAGDGRIQ